MKDGIKMFFKLPYSVQYKDKIFVLTFFVNHTDDIRICYEYRGYVARNNKARYPENFCDTFWNPFFKGYKDFLLLAENIDTHENLIHACSYFKRWLLAHPQIIIRKLP